MTLAEITDQTTWDKLVNTSAHGHPLQLWGWGETKRLNGWRPVRLASEDGTSGAQVLLWPIPKTGRFMAYVPRGPVCDPERPAAMLQALAMWAKAHKALYLRVEPAWQTGAMPPLWVRSRDSIQLPGTYTIDLSQPEDELLGAMDRKHRQYINKSEREGVVVKRVSSDNLDEMWRIYSDTAHRAGFALHDRHYYEALWRDLGAYNWLYYAEVDNRAEAFLWLASASQTAYELYGGVTSVGQEARANYTLKWTAMCELKEAGYQIYDFNGRLNEGVSKFKEGFGPDETNWIGTWDYPINKAGYLAWSTLWPVAKPIGRAVRRIVRR